MLVKKYMKNKTICILGGMGPQASSYFYDLLIKKSIELFGAKNNEDFPDILLLSIPVPDIIANKSEQARALKMLKKKVREVNKLPIVSISIACNTAHLFLADLQKESKVRFISMIEEVARAVKKDNITKVGLLATPSTIKSRLYQKALRKYGVEIIVPSETQIDKLEKVIRRVISGKSNKDDKKVLISIANSLSEKANGIILGCTELPIVFPKSYKLPIFNSSETLAIRLLERYYQA